MDINQTFMERTMDAMAKDRGEGVSLLSLGFERVGLDDAWQACGQGVNGSFHTATGRPIINTTRFPSMSAMNAKAHALGLKSDWCAGAGHSERCL